MFRPCKLARYAKSDSCLSKHLNPFLWYEISVGFVYACEIIKQLFCLKYYTIFNTCVRVLLPCKNTSKSQKTNNFSGVSGYLYMFDNKKNKDAKRSYLLNNLECKNGKKTFVNHHL